MDMNNSRPPLEETSVYIDIPFYVGLISAALKDAAIICNQTDTELSRDVEEISRRARSEGITFLTRTLPSLAKSMDNALATNTNFSFKAFKACKESKLPRFMRSYFELVFDAEGGERSDASAQAIRCIRQVLYLFYKLNLPPTEKQKNEVIQLFQDTDANLSFNCDKLTPFEQWVTNYARTLIHRVLAGVHPLDDEAFFASSRTRSCRYGREG